MKIKFPPGHQLVKFLSQRGFSLMEVMLGGTLLVGVGLAGAYMMKQQKSSQQKINYDINLAQFHQGFVKTFNMSHNCNATLKRFYDQSIPTTNTLRPIYTCTTSACQNLTYVQDDAGSPVVSTSAPFTPSASAWIDDQEIWALKRFSIRGGPYTETSNISLRVTYSLNPRLGTKNVTKEFFVNARFYNGGFKECLSGQESSMNNLQNDFCKSMNQALLDQGSGIVASWDEATQTCVKKDNVKTCPTGETIKGVNPDGSVTCQPINSGFDGASGTQATCVAGQTPKAVFNPTTKAFNMVCDGTPTTGGTPVTRTPATNPDPATNPGGGVCTCSAFREYSGPSCSGSPSFDQVGELYTYQVQNLQDCADKCVDAVGGSKMYTQCIIP
jgi:Tfp pilus assembly protein PilV